LAGEIKNVSVLVALGVGSDGYRRVLDVAEGHKEDKAGWSVFLSYLNPSLPFDGSTEATIFCLTHEPLQIFQHHTAAHTTARLIQKYAQITKSMTSQPHPPSAYPRPVHRTYLSAL